MTLIGGEFERWQIGDLVFSDADLWRLAASCRLVEDGDSRWLGAMPKVPSPQRGRPRSDARTRVLAALTSEPATAVQLAERAGLPGRERGMHAVRALARLEADGLAVSELRRNVARWRTAAAALASQ